MNTELEVNKPAAQNLFWVLLAVFVVLGLDAALRLADLLQQRKQLDQARLVQAQNIDRLPQGQQAQAKLESLSFELLQIALTNDGARKIVQEFNIQFNPGPSTPPPVSAPAIQSPAVSNPPPASTALPPLLSNPPLAPSDLPSTK